MVYYKTKWEDKIIWLLTVALFASFSIFDGSSWVSIILFGITMLVFCLIAIKNNGKIKLNLGKYHFMVLGFCLFCYSSALWAWDSQLAIEKGTTIFELLVCTSVLYIHYSEKETIKELVDAVRWSGYIVVLYSIFFYGIDTIRFRLAAGLQLENSFTNINVIGMTAAMAVVLTVHKIFFIDNRLTASNLFSIPAIIVIAATGSRKGLVLVVVGTGLVLLLKYRSKNIIKTIIQWAVFATLFVLIFRLLLSFSIFEGINARMNGLFALITGTGAVDHSAWLRQQYISFGLKQFAKTPIFGIGMNNARLVAQMNMGINTYLHNNYVELLVDGGIIGFISYYSLYLGFIVCYFRNKRLEDPYLVICGVMIALLLVGDYGSVSYYSKSTYFYFMMFYLQMRIMGTKVISDT